MCRSAYRISNAVVNFTTPFCTPWASSAPSTSAMGAERTTARWQDSSASSSQSHASPESRRHWACTCASVQRIERLCRPFMPPRSLPAVGTIERPDCATYTSPITSLPTFLTQTGIESKSCATHLNCLRSSDGQSHAAAPQYANVALIAEAPVHRHSAAVGRVHGRPLTTQRLARRSPLGTEGTFHLRLPMSAHWALPDVSRSYPHRRV